ncbi:MAG: outer membrane protein transport protein, partial [Betaproteobacteria bacterium]
MHPLRVVASQVCAGLGLVMTAVIPGVVSASNGLNLIGFGTESAMMGGADVAVARDTTALNTNPAGLSRLPGPALDAYSAGAYALDVGHRDALGNDVSVSNHFIPLGGGGYARPLTDRITVGAGMFAQGGAGNVFKHVQSGFGTTDELSALFGILKFSAGATWKATDTLALGVSVAAVYSRVEQRVFPDTSVAGPMPFFGLQLKAVDGVNGTMKAGALYTPNELWTFGATFTPKARLTMDGGRAIVNLTAVGLGNVVYHDVRLSGLALPREVAVGAALQATQHLLIAVKIDWLNWSDALKTSTLTLAGPDQPAAPPLIASSSALHWRNQTVIAVGVAYAVDDATTVRVGFNYGRNPAPAETLNPLLASIGERHFTAGASHRLGGGWEVGAGLEFLPTARVHY